MKITFFENDNFRKMSQAIDALRNRDEGVPGLAVVSGRAGIGKTKAVCRYAVHQDCAYALAARKWTVHWMLQQICQELGVYPRNRIQHLFLQCVEELKRQDRTLFIDEADYLLHDGELFDTVRDLYDWSGVPIVLVGMEEIMKKMARYPQFSSRVSQVVEFNPLTAEEINNLAREWAGLVLAEGCAENLQKITAGDFRMVTVGLGHLERMAKANKSEQVSSKMVDLAGRSILRRMDIKRTVA